MKKAFTLIELLVVIAIIAILAAILFPVFAQAKAAAKATSSISNAKQLALGATMYSGDADDTIVLAGVWNTPDAPVQFTSGNTVAPWSWLVQPYVKNGGIYNDPTNTRTPKLGNLSQTVSDIFVPQYGMNYTYLSQNVDDGDNVKQNGISFSSAGSPAETVFMASKFGYSESAMDANGFISFGVNSSPLWATVEVPDCYNAPAYCAANWGLNDGFQNAADGHALKSVAAGANTGGVSLHATDSGVVAFLDGHVKKMKPGAMAAGTNWTPTANADSVSVRDGSKYIWDLD